MLKNKKFKVLLGIGAILVPTMVFGKTSATVNVDVLDIKPNPNLSEEVSTQMYKGDVVEILELVKSEDTDEAWYEIALEDNNTAFVEQESLDITDTEGIANTDRLNIRSYPDVNHSEVIGQLQAGDEVKLLYKVDKFYKVYVNGTSGFVYADYIDTTYGPYMQEQDIESVKDTITGKTREESLKEENSIGEEIVDIAMKYLGNPYVYGGTSLTNGTDCSGFTQGVMKQVGINIPRTSKSQSQTGTLIAKGQIQKGDLLFFGNSKSSIFHTGIYIGDGKMIHASTPKTGIIIADAYSGGGAPLQVIRRVY